MAPKSELSNKTCAQSETWQYLVNLGQNDGAICVNPKFYILVSIDGSPGILGVKMAPKSELSNKTSTQSETWQYLVNLCQNDGAIL